MESTGRPGQIHITEKTFSFLEDKYISEVGEHYEGIYDQIRLHEHPDPNLIYCFSRARNILYRSTEGGQMLRTSASK